MHRCLKETRPTPSRKMNLRYCRWIPIDLLRRGQRGDYQVCPAQHLASRTICLSPSAKRPGLELGASVFSTWICLALTESLSLSKSLKALSQVLQPLQCLVFSAPTNSCFLSGLISIAMEYTSHKGRSHSPLESANCMVESAPGPCMFLVSQDFLSSNS